MLPSKLGLDDLPWKVLSVEAVLVVASVLLALSLDSWREGREQETAALRALQGFVDEAESNCRQIAATAAYHTAVVAGERDPAGVQVGLLRNDAWEVVKITGAAAWLDYEIVATMSEISARQADHRSVLQAYLGAVFSRMLSREQTTDWHHPGERGVIRELVRIQSDLRTGYRRLVELVVHPSGHPIDTHRGCLPAGNG